MMQQLSKLIWKLRICRDTRGQELVEYALAAGFLACTCGVILPDIGSSVVTVFSKVISAFSPVSDDGGLAAHDN